MVQARPDTPSVVRRVAGYASELWQRRDFAVYLALGNLKARNASTAFGLFWWVLNPLLLAGIYYLVFGIIFDAAQSGRGEDYIAYLVSGMFVFHFTGLSLTGGANAILQNAKLLVNLRFPRLILPIAGLIESGIGFLVSLGTLYLLIIPAEGIWPGVDLWRLVYILPLHLLLNLGLAAFAARLAVPFRDVNNLIPYVNRLWLYVSPIIWPLSFLERAGDTLTRLVQFNPLFPLLDLYRSALLGTPAETWTLGATAAWSLGLGIVGIGLFVRYEGHMVRYL